MDKYSSEQLTPFYETFFQIFEPRFFGAKTSSVSRSPHSMKLPFKFVTLKFFGWKTTAVRSSYHSIKLRFKFFEPEILEGKLQLCEAHPIL